MHTLLLLGILASLAQDPVRGWETNDIPHGPTVHALRVPDATQTAVLTFLPVGLDGDPGGHAQFAHLAEHLMIATTDPQPGSRRALRINGETTHRAMRFESFVAHDKAAAVIERHARWLQARTFSPESLKREKLLIGQELDSTTSAGFNHKWAAAAWAQLMAGRTHAAIRGDIENATVAQLAEYVRSRVDPRRAHILITGPGPTAPWFTVLRNAFAPTPNDLTRTPQKPAASAAKPASPEARRPHDPKPAGDVATWDLQAHHYLEWYRLPDDTHPAEAEIVSMILTTRLMQSRTLNRLPGRALASVVARDRDLYLLISAHVPQAERLDSIRKAILKCVSANHGMSLLMPGHTRMADSIATIPDFGAQRRQVPARIAGLVEANYAMRCGYACVRLGVPLAEVADRYRKITRSRLAAVLTKGLVAERRREAFLKPRE